jgi:phosphopantetheine binding protein
MSAMPLDVEPEARAKLFSLAAEIFGEGAWVNEYPTRALSSIDMMRFVLMIEARFDITVDDDDLGLENFSSMAAVVQLVQRTLLRENK